MGAEGAQGPISGTTGMKGSPQEAETPFGKKNSTSKTGTPLLKRSNYRKRGAEGAYASKARIGAEGAQRPISGTTG